MKLMNTSGVHYVKQRLYAAFVSPLFYVTALIFTLFCSFQFFFMQNFFGGNGTTDLHYFFSAIPYISILVVPVLCIGTDGESIQNLPFTSAFLIFSSGAAVFIQFCAMLLPLAAVPLCVNLFGAVDAGAAAASFILVIFYAAAAAACGVFFFSLLPTNTLAFVFTALVLALTNSVHLVSRFAATSSVVMKAVQALSFSWHFDRAAKGIVDSRDIVYFSAAAVLFYGLAVFFQERRRGKKYTPAQKRRHFLYAVIFVFACLDASVYFFRLDLTSSDRFTVSSYTKNLLSSADDNVYITYYRSSVLSSLYPQTRDVYDFLTELSSADKKVSVCSVFPDRTDAALSALEDYGITSQQIRTAGNNKTEFQNVYSAVVIEYAGKWEVIPFVLSCDTLEFDLAVRLERLLTGKKRAVNILCGNGRSLREDYSSVVPWLSSQGFICNEIYADGRTVSYQLEQNREYGGLLLVLGSSGLSDEDCMAIETYLESGNRVLFAVSPYDADIENSWHITESKNQRLVQMLSAFGTEFSPNLVSDLSCARITMESYENADGSAAASVRSLQLNYFQWVQLLPQPGAQHGITLFWPVPLVPQSECVSPVLFTSSASYETAPADDSPGSLFETNPFVLSSAGYNPQKNVQKPFSVGVRAEGQVYGFYNAGIYDVTYEVIPDQYFVHSLMLGYIGGMYGDYRNLDFLVNRLLRLNSEEELADLQASGAENAAGHFLYKVTDAAEFLSARNRTVFCLFILNPLVIAACGAASQFLRKKQIQFYSDGL